MNKIVLSVKKTILLLAPRQEAVLGDAVAAAIKSAIRPRISETERIIFIKRLAILIKAGISIVVALEILEKQAVSSGSKKLIADLRFTVERGKPLAKAMEESRAFGDFAVNIVCVGEAGGALPQNLQYLAGELQKRRELKRNITGALVYPVFILISTIGVVILLSVYIFPKILPIFASLKGDLPLATEILIAVGTAARDYWLFILAAFILAGALSLVLARIEKLQMLSARCLLALPLVGPIFKNYHIANLSRALSLLLKGKSQVVSALEIAGKTSGSLAYRAALEKIAQEVARGKSIGKNMEEEKIFPVLAAQMIYAGELSGHLEDSLVYLAQICEDEMNAAVKNLSVSVEPILMVFMGLLVGFVAVAIITPIYGITQLLQK